MRNRVTHILSLGIIGAAADLGAMELIAFSRPGSIVGVWLIILPFTAFVFVGCSLAVLHRHVVSYSLAVHTLTFLVILGLAIYVRQGGCFGKDSFCEIPVLEGLAVYLVGALGLMAKPLRAPSADPVRPL